MELSARDAALILNVPESRVYRLVEEAGLPASQVDGRFRFNRGEILEWATSRGIEVSSEIFQAPQRTESTGSSRVSDAIEAGGLIDSVAGASKGDVLRSVAERITVPPGIDRDELIALLRARESIGSTTVGNGIAIPHVRHPLILPSGRPCLTLCFLEKPVDFGASDGIPVHTLFMLVSPTARGHLNTLARVASLLRDESFRQALQRRAPLAEIVATARRVEDALEKERNGHH
jgi:PTS system nitrogen regulatory IIA component